jgi:hypothetical protein
MPFPVGWPPPTASGIKSIRFRVAGTGTADFADNAFLFIDATSANPYLKTPVVAPGQDASKPASISGDPAPHVVESPAGAADPPSYLGTSKGSIFSQTILLTATTAPLDFSFDGTNIHGTVPAGETRVYSGRYEAGICVRGPGSVFTIEAW